MKTQQQAEKEEQQRIKNLVLNYDLQQSEDQEGRIHQVKDCFCELISTDTVLYEAKEWRRFITTVWIVRVRIAVRELESFS